MVSVTVKINRIKLTLLIGFSTCPQAAINESLDSRIDSTFTKASCGAKGFY